MKKNVVSEKERFMDMALELAGKGRGKTHPNPMVGAVIVSSGKVIGRGYHKRAGMPHAEADAISSAKTPLEGAEMFVTLEPCDHYGRTPPCTDAIIASGIKRVHVAMRDPNPVNSGRGIRKLRKAGIEVYVGSRSKEARYLNRAYIKFVTRGIPYITIKTAQSLDGKIAASDGSSKWVSSPDSRRYVKKMRSEVDAVMVGINTVLKDDPLLSGGGGLSGKPVRIVLDSRLRISERSRLIRTAADAPVIVVTTPAASPDKIRKLSGKKGVEVLVVGSSGGRVSIKSFLKKMAEKGIASIMSESGGELAGTLIDGGFVDEVVFFIAPVILGGSQVSVAGRGAPSIKNAIPLKGVSRQVMGPDMVFRGVIGGKYRI